MARSPASTSPAYTRNANTTRWPCCSAGTIGMGGAGMMLAMVESSSGAASAAAMNPAMIGGVAGRISIPPTAEGTSCSRN